MRYKIYVFSIFLCLGAHFTSAVAQQSFVLSGSVKDKQTGESLIKAVVRIQELPNAGIISNEYGFYSLTLPKGNYSVVVSQVGYETLVQKIKIYKEKLLQILSERKIKITGDYTFLGYNAPYQMIARTNEIAIPIEWKE